MQVGRSVSCSGEVYLTEPADVEATGLVDRELVAGPITVQESSGKLQAES